MVEYEGSSPDIWLRWIVGLVIAIALGLVATVWIMLIGQLTDLRTDVRVLQTQNSELRDSVTDLKRRVQDLVDTLNQSRGYTPPSKHN